MTRRVFRDCQLLQAYYKYAQERQRAALESCAIFCFHIWNARALSLRCTLLFFISMSKCDEVTCVFCEICPPRCPHIVNFSRDTKNLRQVLPIPNFIRMLTEVLQFEERSQSVRNIAGSVPQLWYRHGPKVARPHGQDFAVLPKEGRPIVRIVRNSQNGILLRPALRCISPHSAYIFIRINNLDEIE